MRSLVQGFAAVCALCLAGLIGYNVAFLQNGVVRDTQPKRIAYSDVDIVRTAIKHGHVWKDGLVLDELKSNKTNNLEEKTLNSVQNILISSSSGQSLLPGLPDEPQVHQDMETDYKSVENTKSEVEVTDQLHDLYRRLRQNPDQVTVEEMMDQKLLYVRIPKCGSRTFYDPLAAVAHTNVPTLTLTVMPGDTPATPEDGEDSRETYVFNHLNKSPVPYLSAGGHRYVNYRKYGHHQPISFSLFRDPVERFISNFYFVRNGDKQIKNAQRTFHLGATTMNTTLEECATALDVMHQQNRVKKLEVFQICGCDYSSFTHMFCGETKSCNNVNNATLNEALVHLDDFLLVGFTDELETSVKMMEKLLPFYLKGYARKFKSSLEKNSKATRTASKKEPSPEVVAKLRRVMAREYILYDEARKRFEQLKKELRME